MQQLNKMLAFFIFCLLAFVNSCSVPQSAKDCLTINDSFTFRNSNYLWNCGLEQVKVASTKELKYICKQYSKMEQLSPFTLVNDSRGYVEISYKSAPGVSSLIFTLDNGYIFNLGPGGFYRNDELAEYIIDKLEIKDLRSTELCEE